MEELLAAIERQISAYKLLDDDKQEQPDDSSATASSSFVSLIRLNGKPIPPPVMTEQRRHEMRQFRIAAMKKEQELTSKKRLRLLDKVQAIVNNMEERRSSSQNSNVDYINSSEVIDTSSRSQARHLDQSKGLTRLPNTSTEANENQTGVESHIPSVDLHVGLPESPTSKPDANVVPPRTNPIGEVLSAQGSTSSSSDASLLNQTVIAVSDFSKSPTSLDDSNSAVKATLDTVSKAKKTVSGHSSESSSKGEAKALDVTASGSPSLHRIESSESNAWTLSPATSSTSTVLHKSDQDITSGSVNASGSSSMLSGSTAGVKLACSWSKDSDKAKTPDSEQIPPVTGVHLMPPLKDFHNDNDDDIESFGEKDSYLSLLGSTLYTNTLGQSCTLPSTLRTVSAASTLQDIEDPWNTLVETPQPNGDVLNDTVRGTPVGQEDSERNPTFATKSSQHSKLSPKQESAKSSSENDFSSPEKRVRRNSYTLEHPSPALLDAQARNEAPHASLGQSEGQPPARRSLELGADADTSSIEPKENVTTESEAENVHQNKELTEENLLHLQLGYFEEMRKHMEEQQRQQLQQLLIEQQQAQMTLQLEMAELEKQFRQKQGLMAGNKDDGKGLSKEVLRETVDRGEKDVSESQLVKQSSPSSVKSARPSPDQSTSHRTSSPNIPSKHTSPSVITKTSPIVTLTSTVGSGGAVEPFYLGGDHSRLVIGGANSPVTARSPAAEESVSSPVMIRSPYSKIVNSPTMKAKFDRVSAVSKGYLTRRIFQTNKVQDTIKTIKDSVAFADKFISETPIKQGVMSMQDMVLAERVLAQVRAAQYDLYDIFFTMTASQRMDIITQSRKLDKKEGRKSRVLHQQDVAPMRPLSAATVKALERKKKAKVAEARVFGDKKVTAGGLSNMSRGRPRSVAEGRILKPLLSQVSPARPASANTYRPSKYGIVISNEQHQPKLNDPKKLTHEPTRSKVTSQRVPGSTTQGYRSTKPRSPVTVKTKGVRRSLYPIANPSTKKTQRKTPEFRK
ncbi:serine-rich adhesin for platelets-like isoform X2 [Asterias rubens]|uniref:serine-rich adhesin for platelets-like isoform X2 n=1 Tax=Asterias rubens TaxID=7604 RepID=UPI0014551C91|nr:serine-rich adhesin for platelets-like isoform X2 [Asterias rubens]